MTREAVGCALGVAPVEYIPNFIDNPLAAYQQLWEELDWVSRTPRRMEYWTNSYNRPYSYGSEISGGSYVPQPPHELIDRITDALVPIVGFRYEGCFLNAYPNARSGLEWHSDDDAGIDQSRPIAIVTVGAGRAIQFLEKGAPKSEKTELFLESGSLALMKAGCQDTHFHRIPKAGHEVKPRISLTFRSLVE